MKACMHAHCIHMHAHTHVYTHKYIRTHQCNTVTFINAISFPHYILICKMHQLVTDMYLQSWHDCVRSAHDYIIIIIDIGYITGFPRVYIVLSCHCTRIPVTEEVWGIPVVWYHVMYLFFRNHIRILGFDQLCWQKCLKVLKKIIP